STDNLAKAYFGDQGMLGYVLNVQRQEIRQGIACVKHQNMSGSDLGDDHKEYFAGEAALKAGGAHDTMNQFAYAPGSSTRLGSRHLAGAFFFASPQPSPVRAMDISSSLSVDDVLHAFVEDELLAGTGVAPGAFWAALETILADFTPRNAALLARRDELQGKIDGWWKARRGSP